MWCWVLGWWRGARACGGYQDQGQAASPNGVILRWFGGGLTRQREDLNYLGISNQEWKVKLGGKGVGCLQGGIADEMKISSISLSHLSLVLEAEVKIPIQKCKCRTWPDS